MSGIRTNDVCKSFGKKAVLQGLTFEAPEGEVTLLAGLNGAGKTTWIRCALAMASVDSGTVLFAGRSSRDVRASVSLVLDEPSVYPTLSGAENLFALSGGVAVPQQLKSEILEMLGLDRDFMRMRGRAYSLGQKRRLAVAAALLRQPDFLFLDEPTVGLDPIAWGMVRDSLSGLLGRGCAIVLTGQDFAEFTGFVGHVAVMREGVACFDGSASSLVKMRAPRVWLETPAANHRSLVEWQRTSSALVNRFERACDSMSDAEHLLHAVRGWDIPLTGLGIRQDSLEEAFLSVLGATSGSQHA